MRKEIQKAIDERWEIEQDRTAFLWDPAAAQVLARMNMAGRARDPVAASATAKEMQRLINEKADRLIGGVEVVLNAHRAPLDDADRTTLLQRLDSTLRFDVDHAMFVIVRTHGADADGLIQAKAFLESMGAQNRLESLHRFDMMLVAMSNAHREKDPAAASISVVGSSNVQIGDKNIQRDGGSVDVSGTSSGRWYTHPVNCIVAIIAGLVVVYVAYKLKWH